MDNLVYNVHPIPSALHDFIFDFGALSHTHEKQYIQAMLEARYNYSSPKEVRSLPRIFFNGSLTSPPPCCGRPARGTLGLHRSVQ